MSILTIQPANIDTFINLANPTANFGLETSINIDTNTGNGPRRSILKFDFSALPDGAVISAATLGLYYYNYPYTDPVGRTYWAYELTQPAWVETQATWNIYSTGNNWTAAGGDYTTGSGASLAVPAAYGWMNWNVLNLAQHFQSTHSKVAHFLMKDGTEGGDVYRTLYYSREYTTDTTLRPKLIITYTAPTNYPRAVAGAVGWVGGTVKRLASAKRKITGAIYDSLRTQKDILENLIPDPHRAVKNMESLSQAFKGGQGWELCPRYSR
jgi:hypothetical protein